MDPATTISAGASIEAGAFAIDDPAIVAPPGRDLRQTRIDYRSVQVGVGVQRKLSACVTARLECGVSLAREFDYYDRHLSIEPKPAGFGAFTLTATF